MFIENYKAMVKDDIANVETVGIGDLGNLLMRLRHAAYNLREHAYSSDMARERAMNVVRCINNAIHVGSARQLDAKIGEFRAGLDACLSPWCLMNGRQAVGRMVAESMIGITSLEPQYTWTPIM